MSEVLKPPVVTVIHGYPQYRSERVEYLTLDSSAGKLLAEVMRLVEAEGWHVDFVDAVVQAQIPRLNKYLDAVLESLGRFFTVNVKFKSAETLDDSGAGLSMTCWACATLRRVH